MSRRKKLPSFQQATIVDIASDGKSIAKSDGAVVFVGKGVPGDIVDIKVVKKRKNYMEGVITKFHEYSPDRIEGFCEHFGTCGGCKWQFLTYEKQLFYKQKHVVDALTRIGKVELPECQPILPSKETTYYRNKLEFTFTNTRWLTQEEISQDAVADRRGVGFHIPGKFDKVLDIEHCHLQANPSNQIRNGIKTFAREKNWDFFDLVQKEGFFRNIVIRTAVSGDIMVILIVGNNDQDKIKEACEFLKNEFPQITSLNYVVNTKLNDSYSDLEVISYAGEPYIIETMEGLKFRVGPKSFYQTNATQAYELYKITRDFAGLTGEEVVYDLYTGTGTIAQFVATKAKSVVGIEYVPSAIEDAKKNAALNEINNAKFFAGDMKDLLTDEFIQAHGQPDVIITDPPRAGMHESVVRTILKANPKRIVYVSCNPSTQARDLAWLDEKYAVKAIRPVDMFPHTHHVENVVLLELK